MNMKVSKRDISILLFVLGAIAAFCVYQFYFRNAMSQKETYDSENKTLQDRINKLNDVNENVVIADMAAKANELSEKAKKFPATYRYEDLIMYLNMWEELPSYEEIMYNFPAYEIVESTPYDAIGGVLDWDQTNRVPIETSYVFSKAELSANYETRTYKTFKDMIDTIYLDPSPKTIRTVSAVMNNETGIVSGAFTMDFYNVQNGSNVYVPVEIKDVKTGIENVFGPTYTPTPTPTPEVTPTDRPERQGRD